MNLKKGSTSVFILLIIILTVLSGCKSNEGKINGKYENIVEKNNFEKNDSEETLNNTAQTYKKTITIEDIKAEYNGDNNVKNKYMFKPFYNVEQTTEFTFEFKSNVDPIKAVTVHTDSKCEDSSLIYQFNDGYKTENGVSVVVKPLTGVLGVDSRNDYTKEHCWGYAPIYYLCVRYDLDSTTVTKLEEPIIIPFTIKNEISTPSSYAKIDDKGMFSFNWHPVEDAVSYKVYTVYNMGKKEKTCAETGFVSQFLKHVATVDSSVTQYINDRVNKGNISVIDGDVVIQNNICSYNYYVTAVDEKGNESFFSEPVSDWKYADILPYKCDDSKLLYSMSSLPNSVMVTSCDGVTNIEYPINFYKVGEPTRSHLCEYRYEIVGTMLTGSIEYRNENDEFLDSYISDFKLEKGGREIIYANTTAPVDVSSLIDEDYNNISMDLLSKTAYPKEAKIKLDAANLYRRADLEAARLFNDGEYTVDSVMDYIDSYVATDNPEYIAYKDENGTIYVVKASEYSGNKMQQDNTLESGNKETINNNLDSSVETPNVDDGALNVNEEPKMMLNTEMNISGDSKKESVKIPSVINNNNYVEEQRKSTEKQVKQANKEEIDNTKYPVFADTAGQKYLAICLINQKEKISLKAFPEYQDMKELIDDVKYVWYQNPYIMGINLSESRYSYGSQTFTVKYNVDKETAQKYQEEIYKKSKEIVSSIINETMTDYEKVIAIWNYIENNSAYNYEAYNYVLAGNKDYYSKYSNAWNTYGILCEKIGVCQSYSYAFNILAHEAGIETVMVTGTFKNGGHAWNAVKLDGIWYMTDMTNNKNAIGVLYWICNSSTEYIYTNGYRLDDEFIDGGLENTTVYTQNDNSKDWYVVNNLLANTVADCARIWNQNRRTNSMVSIRYVNDNIQDMQTFFNEFSKEVTKLGVAKQELNGIMFRKAAGTISISKQ
ncbi:MAG: hypothetical protein J6C46_10275 [Clostridia bacterium]|nr:hypothetical protein [Clostridia bacterium]